MSYYIGVDIGGTKTAVVLGDESPVIYEKEQIRTGDFNSPELLIKVVGNIIEEFINGRNIIREQIRAVGISCGGPLDIDKGLVLSPPNLPGWDNTPVVSLLTNITGMPVYLQNDANAGALAEWRWGAGRGCENIVFLTFGTGLGAGLILNGSLYTGTNGMAGEVGHIRLTRFGPAGYGKIGALEGYASGGGIAQLAKTVIQSKQQSGEKVGFCPSPDEINQVNAEIVGLAAERGDTTAHEILEISGHYLGCGLAVIIDVLNPEKIIIGSIYSRCQQFLEPAVLAAVKKEALSSSVECCKIVPAELSGEIGDYASLAVAISSVSEKR